MPTADATYQIGVIREWEKGFLEEDEFTRLIDAPSAKEAFHVLADTPYGKWIDTENYESSSFDSLARHLQEVHEWLKDTVKDERVLQFISARYDALNISTALIEKGRNIQEMGTKSKLGSISPDVIQSTVWNNLSWEMLPEIWGSFIKEQLESSLDKEKIVAKTGVLTSVWKKQLAFTPLMREIAAVDESWSGKDEESRPYEEKEDGITASAYELNRDEEILDIIRKYRLDPIGYDPVIAFWYGKEIEVRNLRILLSAKLSGVESTKLRELNRSLYRSLA
jgi:vacuolar-type H+-ATPase subunit C/Vma6